MTSRFDRLSQFDRLLLATLIAATSTFLVPTSAAAQTSNQNAFVFEIKTINIPKTSDIADMINGANDDQDSTTIDSLTPPPTPTPIVKKTAAIAVAKSTTYKNVPAKATGAARVYMQEPEIRAYICPKLGDKCNIFMAVLAAENGTHECTRDNRGLNKNGSIDIGLAQLNWTPRSGYTFEQLQDCKTNLDIALGMYARRGFQPWSAYNKGAYLKHLPAIIASANTIAQAAAVVPEVTAEPVTN